MKALETDESTDPRTSGFFLFLMDVWSYAQVAELLGHSDSWNRVAGDRYMATVDRAQGRLASEHPDAKSSSTYGRYVFAEWFAEFDDGATAQRCRAGGADRILRSLSRCALSRLTRAIHVCSNDPCSWESADAVSDSQYLEICNRYIGEFEVLVAKYVLANAVDSVDNDLAEVLRSGSNEWYSELNEETAETLVNINPQFVRSLRKSTCFRQTVVTDLIAADEIACVAHYAFTKLRIGAPPTIDYSQLYVDTIHELMRDLAIVDSLFIKTAPKERH